MSFAATRSMQILRPRRSVILALAGLACVLVGPGQAAEPKPAAPAEVITEIQPLG